jgi:hypothetical protein
MKYVVLEVDMGTDTKLEVPFVFPDLLVHKSVAAQMTHLCYRNFPKCHNVRCISAGFVSSIDMQVSCYGKSESLNVISREKEDSALISMCDYGSMIKC